MDKKTFWIGILTLTAVVLVVGIYFVDTPVANAGMTIKDRDYQVVTARIPTGGDGLYILDNKTGLIAVFSYDTNARGLRAQAARPVADAFGAAPGRR